ncbi:MAG: tRNA pseudouridine(38-40) synthase TruA [Bacteroidota bacterium]
MSRWKLTFEYDGMKFSGWQKQPDTRTVEGEAEAAFSKLYQEPVNLVGQGRTDAGVHAKKQVAHADLPDRFSADRLIHAMRGMLPKDVSLLTIEKVHESFHARFDAVSRSYSYRVLNRHSPLLRNRVWCCGVQLDMIQLNRMAGAVLESQDFINFCIPDPAPQSTTNVTITESRWSTNEGVFHYHITGNRFLRHMVRRLTGEMVRVAALRQSEEGFIEMLKGAKTKRKGHAAPAHGLYLENVRYE